MQSIASLIETLEILRDAVYGRDQEKAFEAVTIFLLQFTHVFGADGEVFQKTFPLMEQLKDHIECAQFEDAQPTVLAFLAKFRRVNENARGLNMREMTGRTVPKPHQQIVVVPLTPGMIM